ncbi:hypothetical protein [Spirosoma harenae]
MRTHWFSWVNFLSILLNKYNMVGNRSVSVVRGSSAQPGKSDP